MNVLNDTNKLATTDDHHLLAKYSTSRLSCHLADSSQKLRLQKEQQKHCASSERATVKTIALLIFEKGAILTFW